METERLILRRWRESDLDAFARINSDSKVMEFFLASLVRSETQALMDRIEAGFQKNGYGLWAAELKATGDLIGSIGLWEPNFETHFTPCVEVAWRLAHAHWGKGLAVEGARACLAKGFGEFALNEIVSMTAVINYRSRRVKEKLGMTHNPRDDFEHPKVPGGHPLRPHVLYRLRQEAWLSGATVKRQ